MRRWSSRESLGQNIWVWIYKVISPYHGSDVLIRNNDSSGKESAGLVSSPMLVAWGIPEFNSYFAATNHWIIGPFGNSLWSSLQSHPRWLMGECGLRCPHCVGRGTCSFPVRYIKSKHIQTCTPICTSQLNQSMYFASHLTINPLTS